MATAPLKETFKGLKCTAYFMTLNSMVKLWLVAKVLLEMKQVAISEGCSEDGEGA